MAGIIPTMPKSRETILQKRVLERMAAKDVKAAPLALKMGLGDSFVRDILRGKTASPSAANLNKLATALDTSPAYLMGETDEAELINRKPIPSTGIPFRGEVAAGVWHEVSEGVEYPDEWLPFNPLPQYPAGSVYCLTVRGDSLDKIAPPGATLVCIDLYASGIEVKAGDLVIVERAKGQDGLIEMTAKRVRTVNGGFELYPESNNPKWQPLQYPRTKSGNETITLKARVDFILNKP
jgi:SOS-response transcriptional repressor LexA